MATPSDLQGFDPYAWRAILGHSGDNVPTQEAMNWRAIGDGEAPVLWHGTARTQIDGIVKFGLIPGGGRPGGSIDTFCSPRHPLIEGDPEDPIQRYVVEAHVFFRVDAVRARQQGCVSTLRVQMQCFVAKLFIRPVSVMRLITTTASSGLNGSYRSPCGRLSRSHSPASDTPHLRSR